MNELSWKNLESSTMKKYETLVVKTSQNHPISKKQIAGTFLSQDSG